MFLSCGMYISSHVDRKKSCFKVPECIYPHLFIWRKVVLELQNVYVITRKVVLKLGNVYIISCLSGANLF